MDRERPISKESDIYSFAMVVVEVRIHNLIPLECTTYRHKIFTGRAPFHDSTPTTVAVDVLSGNRPERPTHPSLTDDLWDLTERCWNKNPRWRPDISEVVLRLRTTFAPQCGNNTTPVDATLEGVRQRELPSGEFSSIPPDKSIFSEVGRVALSSIPADIRVTQTPTTLEVLQVLPQCRTGVRRARKIYEHET